jgi:hypothetical protein
MTQQWSYDMEETNNKVGAPFGNKNSIKSNRLWAETIRRAVVQDDAQRLRQIAEALLIKASEGDMAAIKELGDRLDGKALQENKLTGDSDEPVIIKIVTGIE